MLDLWVAPDRSVRWKDEDELEAVVEAGRYTAEDARRFRADARAVEAAVAGWDSPFADGWEAWRPDPGWPVPDLPAGLSWDSTSADPPPVAKPVGHVAGETRVRP